MESDSKFFNTKKLIFLHELKVLEKKYIFIIRDRIILNNNQTLISLKPSKKFFKRRKIH